MFDDFSKLMEKYGLSESLKQTLTEIINENLLWISRNSPIIQQFLDDYSHAARVICSVLILSMAFIVHLISG